MHSSLARICDFFLSMLVATVLWMAPGLAATACNFPPGYYRVVNTEPGQDLQLRSDPSSSSMLMGTLHDDDIVFSDGTREQANDYSWQRIRVNQVEGWVNSRHLWRALPKTLAKTDLPMAGYCGASSPPWGLRWDEHSIRMSVFPEKQEFNIQTVQSGVSTGSVLMTGSSPNATMSFVYSNEACQGENNATVGWGSAYIVIRQNGKNRLYKGCCNALRTAFTNR